MTTSLAALASTPSAHSPSTGLISNNSISNTVSTNSPLSNQQQSPMLIDSGEYDSNQDIKSEFHTREGLWKLVKHGEFVRQQQNNYQQSQMSGQLNNGTNQLANNSQTNQTTSNEPVKIAYFKYSNDLLFQHNAATNNSMRLKMQHKNYCIKCMKLIISQQKKISESTTTTNSRNLDHDDDDDIVYYNETTTSSNQEDLCKYCNSKLDSNDSLSTISANNTNNSTSQSLEIVVFNYSREIYFYEFNLFKSKSPSDMKNLIDKKAYRSFVSTCFDINLTASNLNTIDLQNKSVLKTDQIDSSISGASNNTNNTSQSSLTNSTTNTNNNKLNLSPNSLSLILAAGFNKGEIHVFDGFKKEASVFYNNNKFVDKTKVTCIKWLPNSMNLFLAGYSSGNIYLYDANNQTQSNTAPVFTKLYQDESFSVHINNNSNSMSASSSSTNSTPSSTIKSTKSTTNGYTNNANNNNSMTNFNSLNDNNTTSSGKQDKLVLLSSNQQPPVQVAKNPLLKWTIGASNSTIDPSSSNPTNPGEQVFFNSSSNCVGVNGVNEFAFSPCGAYLAVVSQDGYMRVFSFSYQSNQQMHIQLLGSMKSYFGGLLCVTWSSDGKYIATGGEDDLITIFSFIDMRVACRGRGHSSWINCCTFDPWTCLNSPSLNDSFYHKNKTTNSKFNGFHLNSKSDENNDDSDLENDLKNINLNKTNSQQQQQQFAEQKKIVVSKKNRTISTLSDINYNPNNSCSTGENNSSSIYYRLASCGQDNQICFWDLTEECLKEKSLPHSRSRITSINHHNHNTQTKTTSSIPQQQLLPQIIIQPSELINESNKLISQAFQQQQQPPPTKEHHHSTPLSIVSTARNLFSLKHVDSKSKSKQANDLTDLNQDLISTNPTHKNGGLSLTGNFFKKHKRNASLTNTSITNGLAENGANMQSINSKNKSNKNSQVTLNSYKKSSNTTNLAENIPQLNSDSNKTTNTKHTTFSTTDTKTVINSNNTTFNLCPKLDEIPMIEPLICKRIANERLTSLIFREDCFMVSTQDGYVFTWARPVPNTNNTKVISSL